MLLCALRACRHYVMFVGNTGTGKTANIMSKLSRMDPEAMMYTTINMNSFSDAPSLQVMMEQPLEKKSGVRYGPPGSRRYATTLACLPGSFIMVPCCTHPRHHLLEPGWLWIVMCAGWCTSSTT